MRIEGVETTRWETSDNQTSDIRHLTSDFRLQTIRLTVWLVA